LVLNLNLEPENYQAVKKIKLGTGFTVFIIFFGIALLEAFQTQNWPRIIFWLVTGAVFILADNLKKAH